MPELMMAYHQLRHYKATLLHMTKNEILLISETILRIKYICKTFFANCPMVNELTSIYLAWIKINVVKQIQACGHDKLLTSHDQSDHCSISYWFEFKKNIFLFFNFISWYSGYSAQWAISQSFFFRRNLILFCSRCNPNKVITVKFLHMTLLMRQLCCRSMYKNLRDQMV